MRTLGIYAVLVGLTLAVATAEVLPDLRGAKGKARVTLKPGTRQVPVAGKETISVTVQPGTHADVAYEVGRGGVIKSATMKMSKPVKIDGGMRLANALGIAPRARFLRFFTRAAGNVNPTISVREMTLRSDGTWVDASARGSATAFGITGPIPGIKIRLGNLAPLLRPDAVDAPMLNAMRGLMETAHVELAAELNGQILQLGARGPVSVTGTIEAQPTGKGFKVTAGELNFAGAAKGKLHFDGEFEL